MERTNFYEGLFGIERETLRVDREGRLAQTLHPFGDNESITRDFCENQIEIVTPACKSVHGAMEALKVLDETVRETLGKHGERVWLYSNPPHIESEAEIPVANFTRAQSNKRAYREQLERRYGKRLMLFSGIHFNFSFSEAYLQSIAEGDYEAFRCRFYLRLYKQISRMSWLPLLLTAASPLYDTSFDADGAAGTLRSEYASMRSSERGYWNEFMPVLRFESLSAFTESIAYYVEKGLLFSASELYLPVRLKPRGVNSLENFANGISHIELRMFDLNPKEPLGIAETDLEFAHLLLMYLSVQPDFEYTEALQKQAILHHRSAARYALDNVEIDGKPILVRAAEILDDMQGFFAEDAAALRVLEYEKAKLTNRLCTQIKENDIDRG